MGGVSPKTCWPSYKYEIKIWTHCCILLDFLCELYSTALFLSCMLHIHIILTWLNHIKHEVQSQNSESLHCILFLHYVLVSTAFSNTLKSWSILAFNPQTNYNFSEPALHNYGMEAGLSEQNTTLLHSNMVAHLYWFLHCSTQPCMQWC